MHQQAAALHMAQKVVAESRALRGTFDDAGDIRQDKAASLVGIDDAEVRIERGKMIVCNLGMRLAHHGEKRRLAHIRKADQAHVRQQLQLQGHVAHLAREPGLGKARDLPGRGREVHVPPAAAAAFGRHEGLAVGHVVHQAAGFRVTDQGSPRHPNLEIGAVLAGTALSLTVGPVGSRVFSLVAEVHQGRHVIIRDKDNASAPAAVTAVRSAGRNIFFSVERDGTVAAFSGVQVDSRFVNK